MSVNLDTPTYQRRGLELEEAGQVSAPRETPLHPLLLKFTPAWSTDPPTAPGWYWQRTSRDSSPIPMYVFERGRYLFALDPGGKHEWDVRVMRCAWAGPIAEPEP